MPEDYPRLAENRPVIPFGGVRPADSRTDNFQENLVIRGTFGIGNGLDPYVLGTVKDGCLHGLNTRSEP